MEPSNPEDIDDTHWRQALDSDESEQAHQQRLLEQQEQQMPNIDDVFPDKSNHLKADDLKGRAVKVTIVSYEIVEFKGNQGAENKPVLTFEGKEKTLVCNKTNSRMIAKNVGSKELDDWIGRIITIYPTETDFGGDIVPCLRVKEEIPEVGELDDPIPF